jgi:peptidylamidoglycolate lyase
VLPDGSFYVSDGYRNSRVVKFDSNGGYQFEWGAKGEGEGQFHLPHGLTMDAEKNVYVCDRENLRVQVFDPQGRFRHVWPSSSVGHPYGIDASSDGRLFVIDGGLPKVRKSERGKVVELDAEGRVIASFGSYGTAPGQFETGHDIAVGPDGAVYVAEAGGRRVQKFVRPAAPAASPR